VRSRTEHRGSVAHPIGTALSRDRRQYSLGDTVMNKNQIKGRINEAKGKSKGME
jgi:hypothetical protein